MRLSTVEKPCASENLSGLLCRRYVMIGQSPSSTSTNAAASKRAQNVGRQRPSSSTSICHRLGFHGHFLFPRVRGEVESIRNDSRAASLVSDDGVRHQCDSRRLLLHLFLYEPDRRGGSRPFRSETHGSHRSGDSWNRLSAVQRADGTRRGYRTIAARGRFSVRVRRRGLSCGARIFRALPCNCDWRHTMRRHARRLGRSVCCRPDD